MQWLLTSSESGWGQATKIKNENGLNFPSIPRSRRGDLNDEVVRFEGAFEVVGEEIITPGEVKKVLPTGGRVVGGRIENERLVLHEKEAFGDARNEGGNVVFGHLAEGFNRPVTAIGCGRGKDALKLLGPIPSGLTAQFPFLESIPVHGVDTGHHLTIAAEGIDIGDEIGRRSFNGGMERVSPWKVERVSPCICARTD